MDQLKSAMAVAMVLLAGRGAAHNLTIHNGQIFTPGFAVLNAPQPGTPLGGGESTQIPWQP